LTGAGVKWPDAVRDALTPHELVDEDGDAVRSWIAGFDNGEDDAKSQAS
jgi:hypothetical protein